MMRNVKIRPMLCTRCGWKLDTAAFRPRPGQISCCYNCGLLTIWLPDGGMRMLLEDDVKRLPAKVKGELGVMLREWVKVREAEMWKDWAKEEGGRA